MALNFLLSLFLVVSTPQQPSTYTAVVTTKEATFTIPVRQRDRWTWRRPDTRDNQQEYQLTVMVKNEGNEYTFGFYLWKFHGAASGSGNLSDLISAGQKSLFERAPSRLMTIVKDAPVKVSLKGDVVVISLRDKDYLKRLFSSKPADVLVKVKIPDDPDISQTVTVTYK
ncbi:MAG TPA: hypothetical protein VIX17_24505 [Pyrinomonadaceae bacterium]|jgi:hypothetical protein